MYFQRNLEPALLRHFRGKAREGALIPGIVGCGKTTMIGHLIDDLRDEFDCFSFTGDETVFRSAVIQSGSYILDYIKARTNKKALVFVDEVQKEEAIFDAVKIAYDKGHVSFIISGSNPEFIKTKATKRIQRRAGLFEMQPFSFPEILVGEQLLSDDSWNHWETFFQGLLTTRTKLPETQELPPLTISQDISARMATFLVKGGLPLAWQCPTVLGALQEVKKVFERGFEPILRDTANLSSIVAESLAGTHGQEFTYQGIMQRSRVTQRRPIVEAINNLLAHGYLHAKHPWFSDLDHRSYLTVYNYCDPGIVSYLQGTMTIDAESAGHRIEAVCHARLHHIAMLLPMKTHIDYYKAYVLNGKSVRFQGGEIDFIFRIGKRLIPMEVKASSQIDSSDVPVLVKFIQDHSLPFGIVLYGGLPKIDVKARLVFYPWFLV